VCALRTDENLLLFETDMTAGHGGNVGHFDPIAEVP
jgi:protease II